MESTGLSMTEIGQFVWGLQFDIGGPSYSLSMLSLMNNNSNNKKNRYQDLVPNKNPTMKSLLNP